MSGCFATFGDKVLILRQLQIFEVIFLAYKNFLLTKYEKVTVLFDGYADKFTKIEQVLKDDK